MLIYGRIFGLYWNDIYAILSEGKHNNNNNNNNENNDNNNENNNNNNNNNSNNYNINNNNNTIWSPRSHKYVSYKCVSGS